MFDIITVAGLVVTITGGAWGYMSLLNKSVEKIVERGTTSLKDFVMDKMTTFELEYVKKVTYEAEKAALHEIYSRDRITFIEALTQIKNDICRSVNHLTDRVDVLFQARE